MEKKNKKLSKRGKLYLANIIALILNIIFALFNYWLDTSNYIGIALSHTLIQCAFAFLSLIVYYLSIITDALSARNNKDEKNNN